MRSRSFVPPLICAAFLSAAAGCVGFPPRNPGFLAAGFTREPMRRMETKHLAIYYPASHRDVAERIGGRLEACVAELRAKVRPAGKPEKLDVLLTLANWNNGGVEPGSWGLTRQMVLPIHETRDLFATHGNPSVVVGHIACHEAVHAVMLEQVRGPWRVLNAIGGNLIAPNVGLERWFSEGLAVYYEGRLGLRTGRPVSPWWTGMFHAAMSTRSGGRPREGDVSIDQRDLYGTGAYLTASHFIADLAEQHGEDRLWALMEEQSDSWIPVLGLPLRFQAVYGKPLSTAYAEFATRTAGAYPARERPAEQRILVPSLGMGARLAVSRADGAIATVAEDFDRPVTLTVRDRALKPRFNLPLSDLLPERRWLHVSESSISGLSFSPDGSKLYFVAWSTAFDGDEEARLWELDAGTGDVRRSWPLHGMGGEVSADGTAYVFARIERDRSQVARLELKTGAITDLTAFEPLRAPGTPAASPDGARLAFPLFNGETFDLAVREADGQVHLVADGNVFDFAPRWIDAEHLLFLRSVDRHWQIHVVNVSTGAMQVQTQAPYLAFDPFPRGEEILFLNRDGVTFTVDTVPLRRPERAETVLANRAVPALPVALAPPVTIEKDGAYNQADGLLLPFLHVPFGWVLPASEGRVQLGAGVALRGADKLGFHNWELHASWDSIARTPGFSARYLNHNLAPLAIDVVASRLVTEFDREWQGSVTAWRSWWDFPVALGVSVRNRVSPFGESTIAGPHAAVQWRAQEHTRYFDERRGLGFTLSAAVFPGALSTTRTFADLRGGFDFSVPLPLWARHGLNVGVLGRALPGTAEPTLRVGGSITGGMPLALFGGATTPYPEGGVLPGGISFVEPMMGWEDRPAVVHDAAVAWARWRGRFVIDRGVLPGLWIMPSIYFNDVNLEVFGTKAFTRPWIDRQAVGASVSLRMLGGGYRNFWLTYRFAHRLDPSAPPLHLVLIGF